MIPDIGLMVGCYLFTRMIALMARADTDWIVRILAIATAMVAVIYTLDLLLAGRAPLAGWPR
jgi:1,4-dihydroxy-2-naphthoate octaprenyltransferase